jgi:alkylated DNA repair dioxygenase AlkB
MPAEDEDSLPYRPKPGLARRMSSILQAQVMKSAEVIEPGLIYKRQAVLNIGEKRRGRIYDTVTRSPTSVADQCKLAVKDVRFADLAIPKMKSTEVIEPGLVILRNFVEDSECERIARTALEWGRQGVDGFYTTDDKGQAVLNTGEKGRGRIYDAATRFPTSVTDKCKTAVKHARFADPAMPKMECTHLLLNLYTTNEGLVWHRDIYENDGKSDHPVVNMCIGASCRFGFKQKDDDQDRVVTLRSGDILLFGGPCRLIKHAVLEVLLDDCPVWMKDSPVRLSFTFRDSPEILGREDEFKYFRVTEHLVGQEDFEVPADSKKFKFCRP